jgi:hypothetical protein
LFTGSGTSTRVRIFKNHCVHFPPSRDLHNYGNRLIARAVAVQTDLANILL